MQVNVLGTTYEILTKTAEEDSKLEELLGYCDQTTHEIVLKDLSNVNDNLKVGNVEELTKKTLRHEIIHAFLNESGLCWSSNPCESWAVNEEMVDWLALQFPKILKAFNEVNAI